MAMSNLNKIAFGDFCFAAKGESLGARCCFAGLIWLFTIWLRVEDDENQWHNWVIILERKAYCLSARADDTVVYL